MPVLTHLRFRASGIVSRNYSERRIQLPRASSGRTNRMSSIKQSFEDPSLRDPRFVRAPEKAGQRPADGITWKVHVLVFAIAILAIVSRRPDAIFNAQFFGEDGTIWFRDAYALGWLSPLFSSQNGYFQTLPRLAAALALLAPFQFAPLVMNLAGLTFQVLPVNILLSPLCANWAPLSVRAWMAAAYIALPNTRELNVSVEEGQWHLALLACLLVLALPPKSISGRILSIAIILPSGVTGPFCLILLPVSLIFWWLRRNHWTLVISAALAVASMVQLSALVRTGSATRPQVGLGATPQLFARLLGSQVYLGALLGATSSPANKRVALLAAVAIIGTAVVVFCFLKANLEWKLFILFSELVFAASLRNPMVSMTVPQWQVLLQAPGIRYWFFPMLAFVWALIWCCSTSETRLVRIAGAAGLTLMVFGVLRDWKYPAYTDFNFPKYAKQFEAAAPGTVVTIPIYPDGWVVTLTKKDPQCGTVPVGQVDQPSSNAHVSGTVTVAGWVADTVPVERVSISVDGAPAQSVQPNVSRPDVDARYPRSPDKEKGFGATLDLSKLSPGRHEIQIRALERGGCEAQFAVVPVLRTP
jgi:hypothetical protein